MACGTPMLTSKTPAIPEIAGDAALYVNPYDHDEIAAALERLFSDQALRQQLAATGSARALSFPWDRTPRQILSAYRDL